MRQIVYILETPYMPDLIKIGFRKGKLMGKILEKVKMKWIKKEFSLTKKECLSYASSLYPTGARR